MGYVLPNRDSGISYETFRQEFRWDVPDRYNIATSSLNHPDDRQTGIALHHVDEDGDHHEFSYEALDRASDALAAGLAEQGVVKGSHAAVCFPQSPELLVVHLAVCKLGAVVVPLSMLLGRDSIAHTLTHGDVDILIVDEERYGSVDADSGPFEPVEDVFPIALNPSKYVEGADYLGGLAEFATGDATLPDPSTGPDDPAFLIYTSGTSGRPKGVLLGHRYLVGSMPGYHLWFHLFDTKTYSEQRVWTPSEWAWAGALFDVVFPTLAIGGTVVSSVRRSGFDPEQTLEFIEEVGVMRAFMPPTALSLLRKEVPEPETNLPTLEVVQSGGEPLSPAVQDWAEAELDLVVNEGYGQTEANALVGNSRALFDRQSGSMGRPYPGHDIVVVDENDEPLQAGELGELAVQGPDPVFFLEYWNDPAATAEKLTDKGLFRTGDMAVIDEDGYIWFKGRKDDLIVTSGYRVSPVEVEEALERHDLVSDAVVGGEPDPDRGTRITAYVLPAVAPEAVTQTEESRLREFVRDEIGAHKRPHEFVVVDELPRTRSGKTDRSALFDAGDDRDDS